MNKTLSDKIAAEAAQQIIKEAELKPGYSEFHWNEAGISVERVAEIIQSALSQSLAARDAEREQRIAELEKALREIVGLSGLDNEITGPGCSVIVADRMASIHQIAGSSLP